MCLWFACWLVYLKVLDVFLDCIVSNGSVLDK